MYIYTHTRIIHYHNVHLLCVYVKHNTYYIYITYCVISFNHALINVSAN